nr:G-type lectin S-receptor-like serine/threonine-protein kinase At4g27290 [Malus domestica]
MSRLGTVVWVANRCNPINDSSGVLMINSTGNLVLLSQNSSVVWSTSLVKQAQNATVELLDSGNLVLRDAKDGNSGTPLWQSFDYPSDTLLPGMKLGWDLRTGLKRHLSAWKNSEDPVAWNELTICGSPEHPSPRYSFNFVYNDDEVYVTYKPKIESILSRVALNQTTSTCARFQWKVGYQAWQDFSSRPTESCDYYGFCGANGNCTSEDPVCKCIQGFSPKSQEKWNLADWSLGCVRNKPLSCHEGDKDEFLKFDGFKLPDTTNSWISNRFLLLERKYIIRTSAAEIVNNEGENSRKVKIAIIVVGIAIVFSGVLLVGYVIRRRKRKNKEIRERNEDNEGAPRGDMELPLFDLMTVARATDNFSSNKKLGEGGFGPVYKGTLADGQEIAVKRLSRSSSQGLNEFMNEVILIAKLQHRNLVRLLGCCVQGEEKLLLYEYMPNGSLDSSIFDETRRELFDWPKRFNIICGIARGLVYLHQDSRLRIIHRDLKASNVLLDNEMNPKNFRLWPS